MAEAQIQGRFKMSSDADQHTVIRPAESNDWR